MKNELYLYGNEVKLVLQTEIKTLYFEDYWLPTSITPKEAEPLKTNELYPFNTVGKLRKLLEGLPDDRIIVPQVVSEDGKAWNMHSYFVQCVRDGDIAVLQLTHPELKTLS